MAVGLVRTADLDQNAAMIGWSDCMESKVCAREWGPEGHSAAHVAWQTWFRDRERGCGGVRHRRLAAVTDVF